MSASSALTMEHQKTNSRS